MKISDIVFSKYHKDWCEVHSLLDSKEIVLLFDPKMGTNWFAHKNDIIVPNPDTPENRLFISLKYG